jgi:hypothetical protein
MDGDDDDEQLGEHQAERANLVAPGPRSSERLAGQLAEQLAERSPCRIWAPALVGYALADAHRALCPRCGNRLITEANHRP